MNGFLLKGQAAINVVAALVVSVILLLIVTVSAVQTGGRYTASESANKDLQNKIAQLNQRIAEKDAELKGLKQTDNYFYQQGVKARQAKKWAESTKILKGMVERFPQTSLRPAALRLIQSNASDAQEAAFRSAMEAYDAGSFVIAEKRFDEFIVAYPDSAMASRVRSLKRGMAAKQAAADRAAARAAEVAAEQEERANAKLEIVDWTWGQTDSESFVEVTGRVKNISGESLKNVEAVVEFEDRNGQLITTDSALIDYNPILPGQTSTFKVIETYNPAMKKAGISFKDLMGGSIPTYSKRR